MALLRVPVSSAAVDVLARSHYTPNDPDYSNPYKVYGPQQINAEVAWNETTGDPDLINLSYDIKRALVVIAVYQRAAATAATDLIHAIGIKIYPVRHALIQNPPRLFKITVSKSHLSFAAVIARIMKGCQNIKARAIKFDTSLFDISDQQIKNRYKLKFFERFRKIFFETRPGR